MKILKWLLLALLNTADLWGADITPGYTFQEGEKGVTAGKLNAAASGTIKTSFLTTKDDAGASPLATGFYLLLYDAGADVFKKATLNTVLFNHTQLLSNREDRTALDLQDAVLVLGTNGTYYRSSVSNMLQSGLFSTNGGSRFISVSNLALGAATWTNPYSARQLVGLDSNAAPVAGSLSNMVSAGVGLGYSNDVLNIHLDGTTLGTNTNNVVTVLKTWPSRPVWTNLTTPQTLLAEVWTNIPHFQLDVTPSSNDWVAIKAAVFGSTPSVDAAGAALYLRLLRITVSNSVEVATNFLGLGTAMGTTNLAHTAIIPSAANQMGQAVVDYLDAPMTTNICRYRLEVFNPVRTYLAFLNRSFVENASFLTNRVSSTFSIQLLPP